MTKTIIGPADHGRRMTLEEFDRAEGREGHLYELGKGVVCVVDVPNRPHLRQVDAIRQQLDRYRQDHPGVIDTVAGSGECKILLVDSESERHPDLAVYKTPPEGEGAEIWSTWIPELVIEVVSASSVRRDYEEKPEEYLRFGVREYWIIDANPPDSEGEPTTGNGANGANAASEVPLIGRLLAKRRRGGRWTKRVVRPPETYQTPLLPGFTLDLAGVFRNAETQRRGEDRGE